VTRAALVLVLWSGALFASAGPNDPYLGMDVVAGEAHQHAQTLYMSKRFELENYVPGFGDTPHEIGGAAVAYDALRRGGYDWGSVSHHDTNHPTLAANICIDSASDKWTWWRTRVSSAGFPGANPAWNEAMALSRLATSKTVEGANGFLAFTGREFTNVGLTPDGVTARHGGHKVVILPTETQGMCASDGMLRGDEYCQSEYQMYRWMASDPLGQGIVIQAHPGLAPNMDLRPVHPKNAPGGFSDAFVQGVEVSSGMQDPQYEPNYQRMLQLGLRVFPAFGSDSHNANSPGYEASGKTGGTVCWVAARTRAELIRSMQLRRCYFSTSWKPQLRFSVRPSGAAVWTGMGGFADAPNGLFDVHVDALNDPRNFNATPRRGRRFDVVELLDSAGSVLASAPCTRAADGRDTCALDLTGRALASGAIYPRIRMLDPDPITCRSRFTPALLPHCGKLVIGGAIYLNWTAVLAQAPYRQCRFGRNDVPCGVAGCLPATVDRDQDGYPDGCDVCPDLPNTDQRDTNLDGYGDACPRSAILAPQVLGGR
jgi:hypothetical protein